MSFEGAKLFKEYFENNIAIFLPKEIADVKNLFTETTLLPENKIIVEEKEVFLNEPIFIKKEDNFIPGKIDGIHDIMEAEIVFEKGFLTSTFEDLFSGNGWINQEQTTAYQDFNATAFIFPPKIEWKKINNTEEIRKLKSENFIEKESDGSLISCLSNGSCLIKKDLEVFKKFGNSVEKIKLPKELTQEKLFNLSIGALDSQWVVGGVFSKNGGYEVKVFYLNPNNFVFTKIDIPINSSYLGFLGFGGNDNDWLLVYSAYEGLGYRISNLPTGETKIINISNFFRTRLMGGGFEPAIIKINKSNNFDTCWYVFSLTERFPRFLKFFQNRSSEIQGVVDLSGFLTLPLVVEAISFLPEKSDYFYRLPAKIKYYDGREEFWLLSDFGFDKSKSLEIFSVNINNYSFPIKKAKISMLELALGGNQADFFISNNGKDWREVSLKEEISFSESNFEQLYWKVKIYPSNESETSVFFDKIVITFNFKAE
ncbi:hypothetical protein JW698_02825 [Candidatus Wolfebacteria bacterium]|nr:hypothetical protein [Candidatus Wolfebacteria bacterium]